MTIPRHFDRVEWTSIFDNFMNHKDFNSPIDTLELARNYCMEEYQSLPQKEKDFFQMQMQKYIQTK